MSNGHDLRLANFGIDQELTEEPDPRPPRGTGSRGPLVGGEPWPHEVVDLAFEVWAFKCQRNVRETVDFLNNLPEEYIASDIAWRALEDRTMPLKTVANWVSVKKWEYHRTEKMKQLAPAMHNLVEDELRILTIDALRVQKKLLNDDETPHMVRAKVIDSILDRAGHLPFRLAQGEQPRKMTTDYSGSAAGMSIDDLKDMLFGNPATVEDD